MKAIAISTAVIIGTCLLAACNKSEAPAKSEQPAQEAPKNIMRMDKPGPAPDPSKYKGKF